MLKIINVCSHYIEAKRNTSVAIPDNNNASALVSNGEHNVALCRVADPSINGFGFHYPKTEGRVYIPLP